MGTSEELVKTVLTELSTLEADKLGAEEVLRKARLGAEIANKEKGKKLKTAPTREYLLLSQLHSTVRSENMAEAGYSRLLSTTITSEHPPCSRDLKELQPILIEDLRAETVHTGYYVVLRTISVPFRQVPLVVIAEDHAGHATMVTLFNMNIDRGDDNRFMPVNSYFVVRTPFYKMSGRGLYAIRVDHPSDCIRTTGTDPFVNRAVWNRPEYHARHVETDVEKLKETAGNYFVAGNYQAALEAYDCALDRIPFDTSSEMWRKIFCNRIVTQLKMGRYEAVLGDTTFLLPNHPDTRRPLFLQARAYYNLRNFQAARKAWEAYISFAPNDKDGQKHLKMTMARLDEEATGNYNLKRMTIDASQTEFPRLDHADYLLGVEVKKSKLVPGQRGLFARRDFKQGDLVLCEKAFQICYRDEIVNQTTVNVVRNRLYKGPDARLPSMVTQCLYDNPSLAPKFFDLYCRRKPIGGDLIPAVKDGESVIDAFTVASIIESNAFKVENSSRRAIGDAKAEKDAKSIGNDTGIWLQSSYLNHSCMGNVSRSFIGDMMVVRARRSIKKGEELLHTYVPSVDSAEQKKKAFRSLGFFCKCEVCQLQNSVCEEEHKRRQATLVRFDKLLQRTIDGGKIPTPALVSELRGVINNILETYSKRDYCFDLIKPYEMIFGMNYYLRRYSECVRDLRDLLRYISGTDIGDFHSFEPKVWCNDIITILVQFCLVLEDMGDNTRAKKCQKILRMQYGNVTGLGFELSPYDKILERFRTPPPLR